MAHRETSPHTTASLAVEIGRATIRPTPIGSISRLRTSFATGRARNPVGLKRINAIATTMALLSGTLRLALAHHSVMIDATNILKDGVTKTGVRWVIPVFGT